MSQRVKPIVTAVFAALVLTGAASAQSRSSFLDLDALGGVGVSSPDPLNYTVTVALAPTLVYLGTTYTINSVFGFWVLSDDDNLTPVNVNFVDADGASWQVNNNNGGAGGIAGWNTNPNTGITPGDEPVTFSFTSLAGSIEGLGMHIRVNENLPTGGNTAYFIIPTPATGALLGLAGLAATRRRRC